MAVSDNLKVIRLQRNLTQKELGDLMHVSDKTISTWESGRSLPDIDMIKELAKVLNVKYEVLVDGETTVDKGIAYMKNFYQNNKVDSISVLAIVIVVLLINIMNSEMSFFISWIILIGYFIFVTVSKSWWFLIATLFAISQFTDTTLFYLAYELYNPNIAAIIGVPAYILLLGQIVIVIINLFKKNESRYRILISNLLFVGIIGLLSISFDARFNLLLGSSINKVPMFVLYMVSAGVILGFNQIKLFYKTTRT